MTWRYMQCIVRKILSKEKVFLQMAILRNPNPCFLLLPHVTIWQWLFILILIICIKMIPPIIYLMILVRHVKANMPKMTKLCRTGYSMTWAGSQWGYFHPRNTCSTEHFHGRLMRWLWCVGAKNMFSLQLSKNRAVDHWSLSKTDSELLVTPTW